MTELDFRLLQIEARRRLAGVKQLSAFAGGYTDPWLEWRVNHLRAGEGGACDRIIVLQDWGDEWYGTVSELEALKNSLNHVGPVPGFDDPTLRVIKKVIGVGNICSSRAILMNAVWAARSTGTKKTKPLGKPAHVAAFPIWTAALLKIQPREKVDVYLCGSWAKWDNWGSVVKGADLIRRWNEWSKLKTPETDPRHFEHFRFTVIPHPSWSNGEPFQSFFQTGWNRPKG